jgi:hypothetical protein
VLATDNGTSQLKGADVLMSTLHNDPSALRAFLVGPDQYCSPRQSTPFNSCNDGLMCGG